MATTQDSPLSRVIKVGDMEWEDLRPGIRAKNLWSDEATKRRAIMTRIEPGAALPMHRHDGDELIFVLEGTLGDEFGTVTAGNMGYRPNGCVHTVSSPKGASVIAVITGGIEPTTERGDAPPSQIFTVSDLAWTEARPGVRMKNIWQDPNAERRAVLARFEPGAVLPLHRHIGDELIFLIEGSNADEAGEVATGNMSYRPNGCTHTVTTKNGATSLNVLWGHADML
jgi:anti-sigma factor ChrR (cupin superfamily)